MCFGRKKKPTDNGSSLPNARHLRPPAEIRTSFKSLDFSGSTFSSFSEKSDKTPYMISPCPSPCTTTTNLVETKTIIDNATLEQRDVFLTTKGDSLEVPVVSRPGSVRTISPRDDTAFKNMLVRTTAVSVQSRFNSIDDSNMNIPNNALYSTPNGKVVVTA